MNLGGVVDGAGVGGEAGVQVEIMGVTFPGGGKKLRSLVVCTIIDG